MSLLEQPDYSWIDPKKIEQWTKEGHWPPPAGITLVQKIKPDPKEIEKGLNNLLNVLSPELRQRAQEALARNQS